MTGTASDTVSNLVKLALLVRLVSVALAMGGLVGSELTPQTAVSILLLAGTSFVGLSQPAAIALVVRHPLLAMIDVAAILAVFAMLGVRSPLTLGALSTALVVGVLFAAPMAVIMGGTLVLGYALTALADASSGELGFVLVIGLPAAMACLVAVGQTIRRMEGQQREAEQKVARMLQAGAVAGERSRLAREMHDSLAKSLQGLAMGAAALPAWVDRDGALASEHARTLADGANQAVQEARILMGRMRADQPELPFHEVVTNLVEGWAAQHGRRMGTQIESVPALSADVRYEVLAAVSEALENVSRHAPDATVAVTLTSTPDGVNLTVADDGPGFAAEHTARRESEGHFGLRGMSERLASVGGRAMINSAPGMGTSVVLAVPASDPALLPTNEVRATVRRGLL